VELMMAVQHAHARVCRAAGTVAATAGVNPGRVFRRAVGWRREGLEADRAARLGRSAHLNKEPVQPRAEHLGLGCWAHRCLRLATKVRVRVNLDLVVSSGLPSFWVPAVVSVSSSRQHDQANEAVTLSHSAEASGTLETIHSAPLSGGSRSGRGNRPWLG